MFTKSVLGIDQCQAAINAMMAELKKDANSPAVGLAIVDEMGNLISYARMDGVRPVAAKNAIKKAYTAAIGGADSGAYVERLNGQGRNVAEMGDPMLLPIQGGVVVRHPTDGSILGGIGVAGLPGGHLDENMSRVGLNAMNL